jgi:hypothetical protein
MKSHKKIKKIKKKAIKASFNLNRLLQNYKEVIWLVGSGRSGTTWVSDLLNYNKNYREMFEPFHPHFVKEVEVLSPHQYVRPGERNQTLERFSSQVFSGKFQHPRVDGYNGFIHKGLLIKDIFANLFARWAFEKFPEIKIIFLIRNPFAVALSILKKSHWFWPSDPSEFLKQETLFEDFLQPYQDLIKRIARDNDPVLKQILIWSIINYVPLRQFRPDDIHVCFYEDIFTEPNVELSRIFNFIGRSQKKYPLEISKELITRPSRVSGPESNVANKKSPISSWKNELTIQQIDSGFEILERFGLDGLYGEDSMPKRAVIESFFKI